jgi:hypothetical protein
MFTDGSELRTNDAARKIMDASFVGFDFVATEPDQRR